MFGHTIKTYTDENKQGNVRRFMMRNKRLTYDEVKEIIMTAAKICESTEHGSKLEMDIKKYKHNTNYRS